MTSASRADTAVHGGRTPAGVLVPVWQRILATATAIWHNDHIGARIKRSLTAYDH